MRQFLIVALFKALSVAVVLAVALFVSSAAPATIAPLPSGKWPPWSRGDEAYDIKVSGNYAYLAGDYGLVVIDISNPTNCSPVGGYPSTRQNKEFNGIALDGNFAYVTEFGYGLHVIDVSDPAHCRRVGGYNTPGDANGLALSGGYAFVADGYNGLQVVDVRNPTDCFLAAQRFTSDPARGVAVSEGVAYVVSSGWTGGGYSGHLVAFDISIPSSPVYLRGWDDVNGRAEDLDVSGGHAFLAGSDTLQVFSVSNSASILPVGEIEMSSHAVTVVGNRAYLAEHGLAIIDVSNPVAPKLAGRYGRRALTATVRGDYAYLGNEGASFEIVNVSNPSQITRVGGCDFGGQTWEVAVSGRYAYLADGSSFKIVDVSNPTNVREVGVSSSKDLGVFPVAVALSDDFALLAAGSTGLHIVHLANSTNCTLVRSFDTSGSAFDVAVSGSHAYVADLGSGLQIIDISNPTNCFRAGGFDTSGYAFGVDVVGNYAYVADDIAGLQVIDISNPTNCVWLGGCDTGGRARGITVSGRYGYVADEKAGLQIIDISDPAHCFRVGGYYDAAGYPRRITLSGNYAYMADGPAGLKVIDVSNPSNCVLVASLDTKGSAYDVTVVGDRIYIADVNEGLIVLPTLPNLQQTIRIDATPNLPFTLEAATNLADPNSWQPLLTTNVATMPFDFVDFDVKLSDKPQKFYRVRQP